MAYGLDPAPKINTSTFDEFCTQLEKLKTENNDVDVEVGMTSEGRLVTKDSLAQSQKGMLNYVFAWFSEAETFEDCQENLSDYLHSQKSIKKLGERNIDQVNDEQKPTFGDTYELGLSLKAAPFKDDVDIYEKPADNMRVPGIPELREGDLSMLGRYVLAKLGSQLGENLQDEASVKALVLKFFEIDKQSMLEIRDDLHTQDLDGDENAQQVVDKLGDVLIAWQCDKTAIELPAGIPEPDVAPSPPPLLPSEHISNLFERAEMLREQGQSKEAFDLYREIAETCKRGDNPDKYNKSVRIMGEMFKQKGGLQLGAYGYTFEQMLAHLTGLSKEVSTLFKRAQRLQQQGKNGEAFEIYRQIVDGYKKEDNPTEYDWAKNALESLRQASQAPEKVAHRYEPEEIPEDLKKQPKSHEDEDFKPVQKNDSLHQPEPVDERSGEMARTFVAGTSEAAPPQPMKVREGLYREYEFSDKLTDASGKPLRRMVDVEQVEIPEPENEWVKGTILNPKIPMQDINNLDYRVEADPLRVRDKIGRSNQNAQAQCQQQNPEFDQYKNFKPNDQLREAIFDGIEDSQSESSRELAGAGAACARGRRRLMEDSHIMGGFEFKAGGQKIPVTVAGVYDGHGNYDEGHSASKVVSEKIIEKLTWRLEQYNEHGLTEAGIWNALKLAMVDLDRMESFCMRGTTACTALVIQDRVWVVNVGDSRAMLANEGEVVQLSEDAKPGSEHYDHTVKKRGGQIIAKRYVLGSNPPKFGKTLSTSRSIGDHQFGGVISARGKITSHPVNQGNINSWLVIGCDGVYDVATSGQVAQLVNNQCQANPDISAEDLAKEIVSHSYSANSGDNLSVVVVPLKSMVNESS